MKLLVFLVVAALLVVIFRVKAAPGLSVEAARERLKQGALVIDVRTVAEFQAGHLANAVNIPLDELKTGLPRRFPDRSTVLLLHCRSGRRSGIAEGQLHELGYTNAFNLGSFAQARKIVESPAR
jgi:phage shock protein E